MKAKDFWFMKKLPDCEKMIWYIVDGDGDIVTSIGFDDNYHFGQEICNLHNMTHLKGVL